MEKKNRKEVATKTELDKFQSYLKECCKNTMLIRQMELNNNK